MISTPEQQAAPLAQEWVTVPDRPTVNMLAAWWRQRNRGTQEVGAPENDLAKSDFDCYAAMLSAAPVLLPANSTALERSIADIDAFERDGISLCEVENEVSFTEGILLCVHELKRLRAAIPASVDGYKLVPIVPVREMCAAGGNAVVGYRNRHHDKVVADVWEAMLAAAPTPKPILK